MSSDSLQRLRSLAKEQTRLFQSHQREISAIHEIFAPGEYKNAKLQQVMAKTQAGLSQLSQRRQTSMAEVKRRAAARTAKPTNEGRAKVQHALDHGFNVSTLADQLVQEGDKEGLESLRAYLPYASKAGQLSGKPDDPRALEEAHKSFDVYDERAWDENERRWNTELNEARQNEPLMAHNEGLLEDFLDGQFKPHAFQQLRTNLYHWQGTNEAPAKTRGTFNANTYQGDD